MFEAVSSPSTEVLRDWLCRLAGPVEAEASDGDLVDQIEVLERLKAGCAARQARLAVVFEESQRAAQVAAGVPAGRVGRGVGEQVALARRESPSRGSRHLGFAKALVGEMPATLAALAVGDVSEWTATLVVQETACLAVEDRRAVDAELAGRLGSMGPARARAAAWAAACRLDPASAVARSRRAVSERRVSLRPAPDTMTYLTALLPVRDGVAVYAALDAAGATARAAGDGRGRGQVMADTLVQRLTRPAVAGAAEANAASAAVEVHLVMSDETLLRGGAAPGLLTSDLSGSNTAADLVPAPVARDLVRHAATVWVRRLYADPASGQLVAMESTRRVFEGNLRRMLILRDQTCRTPWCEAPIRHGDHVRPAAAGGPTSLRNGHGLCERCNHTKSLPGWAATVVTGTAEHSVRLRTPTGHTYDSTAPPLPIAAPRLAVSPPLLRAHRPRGPDRRSPERRSGDRADNETAYAS